MSKLQKVLKICLVASILITTASRPTVTEEPVRMPEEEYTAPVEESGPLYLAIKREILVEASAYCPTGNKTATGTVPVPKYTIAVDPDVISLGTEGTLTLQDGTILYVRAEDTGCRDGSFNASRGYYTHVQGNRVDLFLATRQEAIQFGRQPAVFCYEEIILNPELTIDRR